VTRRKLPALLAACAPLLGPLALAAGAPGGSAPAGLDDVLWAEGVALPGEAAADAGQREQIRALLESARGLAAPAELRVEYPLEGSIFPPDMIAPTLLWRDGAPRAERWLVDVALDGGATHLYVLVPGLPLPTGEVDPVAVAGTNEIYRPTPEQAACKAWRPAPRVWEAITRRSVETPARLTFHGYAADQPTRALSSGSVRLSTSRDPVGAPVFYRDVPLAPPPTADTIMPLPQGALPVILWRLRDVSRGESRIMLRNMPTCANCHSFSDRGKVLGMDIDGPRGDKGAYALAPIEREMVIDPDEIVTWNAFAGKPEGHKTLGFMSRVSPDGRFAVTTLNEQIYVANFPDFEFGQVFYPTRGILGYYDRQTQEMKALAGADDPRFVQTGAAWSPDGKWLVFARAPATEAYPQGKALATYAGDPKETPLQYDLYRMPFAEGRGGVPEPVLGASANGFSNSFPKVSPDGKWIVHVRCRNGLLMRPDSRLWIVPFEGGPAREMRCNTSRMNSWHSFSPNGRWMVFSSKVNTPYTQMFLTHIDEAGNDSPPILIENSTASNRAVNIPEFVDVAYDDFARIDVPVAERYRNFHRGNELALEGRHAEAVAEYDLALTELQESRIYDSLVKSLMQVGRRDRAIEMARKSLELNDLNFETRINLAFLLVERGQHEEALGQLTQAVRIHPLHPQGWYNRATLLWKMGRSGEALADYDKALRVQPRYPDALDGRALARQARGDLAGALTDLDESIRLLPADPAPWYYRAALRRQMGQLAPALQDVLQAERLTPEGSPQRADLAALRRQIEAGLGR
jgi:tetratricopeptide (TPR) repeat protein